MFQGAIPAPLQSILSEYAEAWDCEDVFVACSGNFTVERVLHPSGRFRLHGNDVTIYSCALGSYLAGQPFPLAIRDVWKEEFAWLEPYLETPESALATVLLATRMTDGLGNNNPYYRRIREGYRLQWPTLHQKAVNKINGLTLRLASFYVGDALDWLDSVPKDAAVVSYPPFITGGYERMFGKVHALVNWPAPSYQEMDEAGVDRLLEKIVQRRHFVFGVPRIIEQYRPFLRAIGHTTAHAVPLYIYASDGHARCSLPHQKLEPLLVPHLALGEAIGDRLAVIPIAAAQFGHLRSLYMNAHIKPGQWLFPYAVLVDDRLIGAFAFRGRSTISVEKYLPTPCLYLLSDFAVAPTDYRRLAKLVLYAALSRETQLLAERTFGHRCRSLVTTAFSLHPTSMKYRGLLTLLTRKRAADAGDLAIEDATGRYLAEGYVLNYGAEMGQWSLAEGLAEWKRKHGQRATSPAGAVEESP